MKSDNFDCSHWRKGTTLDYNAVGSFLVGASRVKLIAALLGLLSASSAAAQAPQGPPPWSCKVYAACNGENLCVNVLGAIPMGFTLSLVGKSTSTYDLVAAEGYRQTAVEFSSIQTAAQFAETSRYDDRSPLILVRAGKIADVESFWLISMLSTGTDRRLSLAEEMLLVSCGRLKR